MSGEVVFSDSKMPPEEEYDLLVETGKLPSTDLALPKSYLSVSQVRLFQSCPRAYEWRYVKDVISPPQARMAEGQAVHRSLEHAHRQYMKSRKMVPLDTMLDTYNDAWNTLKTDVEVWDEDDSEERILKRARAFLLQYHTKYLPLVTPIVVEQRFWISLGKCHIPLNGYIDLIADDSADPDTREVIDYKVVSKSKSQADANNDMQLTVYSHAAGLPKVRFDQFVKTAAPAIKVLRSNRDRRDFLWVQDVFESVAGAISAGNFPPCDPGSWLCTEKWCGFWKRCRGK